MTRMRLTAGTLGRTVAALALLFLVACDDTQSELRYSIQADNYRQANEIAKAEAHLKEGLMKYPNSNTLKMDLFDLYRRSNTDEAEKYLAVVTVETKFRRNFYSQIADDFMSEKKYQKANKYYSLQGEAVLMLAVENQGSCFTQAESIEAYRNAAAAASNMRSRSGIQSAFEKMQKASEQMKCPDNTLAEKYFSEVADWLN